MRSTVRILLALTLATLALATSLRAELFFPQPTLQKRATPGDRTLTFDFAITNRSSSPVRIIDIATSCGCTTATASKPLLASGEDGSIRAEYNVGLSEGSHRYTLSVRTDESPNTIYTLVIEVEIPTASLQSPAGIPPFEPRELIWSRPPFAAKTITIDLARHPDTSISAHCDSPSFTVTIDAVSQPLKPSVTVQPDATTKATRATLILEFSTPGVPPRRQSIPLIMLNLPSHSQKPPHTNDPMAVELGSRF